MSDHSKYVWDVELLPQRRMNWVERLFVTFFRRKIR